MVTTGRCWRLCWKLGCSLMHGASQEGAYVPGIGILLEHSQAHRAAGEMIDHHGHPVTEGPALGQAEGKPQGPRLVSACSRKNLEHVFIVPTTIAAFHGHAVFVGVLLQQGQRQAIQPGEVLSKMLITDA